MNVIRIAETDSTNRWIREYNGQLPAVVVAESQTDGRGQGNNSWESEPGQNLTLSLRWQPTGVKAAGQFVISMAVSVAIRRALKEYLWPEVTIKWPNDIYVEHEKLCGILIECHVQGDSVTDCIAGIGLNVNQEDFFSNAPNPTSMALIEYKEFDREQVLQSLLRHLEEVLQAWDTDVIRQEYRDHLFRHGGEHLYRDANGMFVARLAGVQDDGHLLLRDRDHQTRCYAFKEVQFVI